MSRLYVDQSRIDGAGRGVFAGEDFALGELVERCPVIEIDPDCVEHISETVLIHYIYYLEMPVVVLGLGSIYNHSYQANAKFVDKSLEGWVDFVATKSIKKDEEILVNYNPGGKGLGKLWFEG